MRLASCQTCGIAQGHINDGSRPPVTGCVACPPKTCKGCGQPDHISSPCTCWVKVYEVPFADLKVLFAWSDISLNLTARGTEGSDRG